MPLFFVLYFEGLTACNCCYQSVQPFIQVVTALGFLVLVAVLRFHVNIYF